MRVAFFCEEPVHVVAAARVAAALHQADDVELLTAGSEEAVDRALRASAGQRLPGVRVTTLVEPHPEAGSGTQTLAQALDRRVAEHGVGRVVLFDDQSTQGAAVASRLSACSPGVLVHIPQEDLAAASAPLERLRLAARLGRPLVVAAGPLSTLDVDHQALPADAVVFRSGPFDAEHDLLLGASVDAWFATDAQAASGAVEKVLEERRYDVRALVLRRTSQAPPSRSHLPVVDVRDVLAEHPRAARLGMEPRPLGALAEMALCGVVLGFTEVLLLDGRRRAGGSRWPWVEERARPSPRWDVGPSLLSSEIRLLEGLADAFPGIRVLDASARQPYRRFLPAAPAVDPHLEPVARADRPDLRCSTVRTAPDGSARRVAFVTVCDSAAYLWGVRALAASLARVSDVPLLVLVPPGGDLPLEEVENPNVRFITTQRISNPTLGTHHQQRFRHTYSKLAVFGLTFLDRAVYLDSDTIVLRPLDELFDGDGFAAAPDMGFTLHQDTFNSGVFAFTPDAAVMADMLDAVPTTPSYDGGDQGFLNSFVQDVVWLDRSYNTLRRLAAAHPDLFDLETVHVLHYVGQKPWSLSGEDGPGQLDRLWFAQLTDRDKLRYVEHARAAAWAGATGTGPLVTAIEARRARNAGRWRTDVRLALDLLAAAAATGHPVRAADVLAHASRRSPRLPRAVRRLSTIFEQQRRRARP